MSELPYILTCLIKQATQQAELSMLDRLKLVPAWLNRPNPQLAQSQIEAMQLRNLLLGMAGGGAVGALGGAGLQLARQREGEAEENQPSVATGALGGALLGGLTGAMGGGVAAFDAPRRHFNQTPVGKLSPVPLAAYLAQ